MQQFTTCHTSRLNDYILNQWPEDGYLFVHEVA